MRLRGCFILDGHDPVEVEDLEEWAIKFFSMPIEERRVALDAVGDDVEVSTVFIGQDPQSMGRENVVPRLFETMVFGGQYDRQIWRWHTWDEAEQGHKRIVEMVRQSQCQMRLSPWPIA